MLVVFINTFSCCHHPSIAILINAEVCRKLLLKTSVVWQYRVIGNIIIMISKHSHIRKQSPYVTFAVASNSLYPVVGIFASLFIFGIHEAETVGHRIVSIDTAVCANPKILILVFVKGIDIIVALHLFIVVAS